MEPINQLVPNNKAKAITPGRNTDQYITIHETGNNGKGANAQAHANLQAKGNSRNASWHIQVDEAQAIRSWLDTSICWHAGASYPKVSGNPRSIGIEICVNSDGNFKGAVSNAAKVTAHLMKKHGIPLQNVVQHNFWSGKNCPQHLRAGDWGITWNQFKQMVQAEYSGRNSVTVPTIPLPYAASMMDGVQGAAVRRYQSDLTLLGFEVEADGIVGPATIGATVKFQKEFGLHADGIGGIDTQLELVKAVERHMKEHDAMVSKPQAVPGGDVAVVIPENKLEVDEMFELDSKAMRESVLVVLKAMENDDKPLADKWRKEFEDGEMKNSTAIALLYVAVARGYFGDATFR